jgi:hypothetical protein
MRKIISGGQTGVDRAGLDAAIKLKIPHGGWCPLGRKAEDGVIPAKYRLTEGPSPGYPWRTEANVRSSSVTLIYCQDIRGSRGTALTVSLCRKHCKPCIDVIRELSGFSEAEDGYNHVATLLRGHSVINVAGPRESTNPGIHDAARDRFLEIFRRAFV